MSEQGKKAAEGLNVLLEKMNDSGRERLLDFGNGYIRGFRDGSAVKDTEPEEATEASEEAAAT